MLDLKRRGYNIRRFINQLEFWIIKSLKTINIESHTNQDKIGIWVAKKNGDKLSEEKIASIGLRVRKGITFHGISLNVNPNLENYKGIKPCGYSSEETTSIEDIGRKISQKELDEAVRNLRIKTSGCFNSCGQHHIADMGFYGNSRTYKGYKVPHFQVVLGGQWKNNAGSFGLAIGAVPSKNIPKVVLKLADYYINNRSSKDESFQKFISSRKKSEIKLQIQPFMEVPPYLEDASYYTDWGDPRVFTLGDMGVGECAGEVVSLTEVELQSAERICFEAQVELDEGNLVDAEDKAYKAMLRGATA